MYCTYCGEPATTIDHVPPSHARQRLRDSGWRGEFLTVHSCRECNCAILNGHALFTVGRRRRYVAVALTRRHRKVLRAPEWTSGQMGSLGSSGYLRRYIENAEREREILKRRIEFAGGSHPASIATARTKDKKKAPIPWPKAAVPVRTPRLPKAPPNHSERFCRNCAQLIPAESSNVAYCDMHCQLMHTMHVYDSMSFEMAIARMDGAPEAFRARMRNVAESRRVAPSPPVRRAAVRAPSVAERTLPAPTTASQPDLFQPCS